MTADTPTATVADRRTHPATVPIRYLKDAPGTLLAIPAGLAWMSDFSWGHLLWLVAALAVVALFFQWLAWRSFTYGVGVHDLVIQSGLLTRTRRSIPFDRIQDVDIERGPLQRLFGLAKIRIETGGSGKDEGVIDSVTLAEADRLRAAVRAGQGRDGAQVESRVAGDPVAEAGDVIFAMTLPRVLVAGLFNFSLVYLAGLFGLLQSFKGLLPFDIYDPGRWFGLVDERLHSGAGIGAIAAVLLVAVILGLVFGVVRTLAQDFGFTLFAEGARLRRVRGLLTRSEVVLAKARVQLALLRTGPLRALGGWGELAFQTLSGAAAAGERQSVAPLAREAEVEAILAAQGRLRLPKPEALEMVSSRHLVRTFAANALLPTLIVVAAGFAWRPALFALAIVPMLVAGAFLERRFHRYGLADDLLFIRRGVWRRSLWMVPLDRIQTIDLKRSWLQRRLGLATLAFDTAGAPALGGVRIVDLRLARAAALLEDLAPARYSGKKSGTER